MRFAWLRSKEGRDEPPAMGSSDRLIHVLYNFVWFVPVILVIAGLLSYQAGSIGFLAMSAFRAVANLYRNNVLTIEAAERFPLRSP